MKFDIPDYSGLHEKWSTLLSGWVMYNALCDYTLNFENTVQNLMITRHYSSVVYVPYMYAPTVFCYRFQILAECTNLMALYLHANMIADIREVDKLSVLKHLRKFTIHGNPIEKNEPVRLIIVYLLQVSLQFCGIFLLWFSNLKSLSIWIT